MAENQETKSTKSNKGIIITVLILLLALFIVFLIKHDNGQYIHKIYKSYNKNAAVCVEKYDNQEVKFKCKISYISSDLAEISVVPVKGNDYSEVVLCKLGTEKLQKKAKKLKNEEVVKVKGILHVSGGGGRPYIYVDTTKIS